MLSRVVAFRLFPALFLMACAPPAGEQAATPPAVDSAAVKGAVAALWGEYAVADSAGNAAAAAALFTDSTRLDLKGLPPIVGRAAWQEMAAGMYRMYKYSAISVNPEITTAMSNDLAYQAGSFHQGMTDLKTRKQTTDYGRYATAVRKDADGKWRVAYMMVFTDSTVAAK